MNLTKNRLDKLKKEKKESKLIEKYADQWCKDNGYPHLKRKYVYRGKWQLVEIKR